MADEQTKVVGLDGKPADTKGHTPERLIKVLEDLLADVKADTYMSFAAVLVDPSGLAVTVRTIAPGQLNATLGGMEYLKYRICKMAEEG